MTEWSEKWYMKLNYKKSKVIHMGKNNPQKNYYIFDAASLTNVNNLKSEKEYDLGITITSNGKWDTHASEIASKANHILGWMKNKFISRDAKLWKKLYTVCIRPHLEFATPACNNYSKLAIQRIERIQKRATKVPHSLKKFQYEDRLQVLNLDTLTTRRARFNSVQ
ncbi:uncharacterized protein LOC136087071 [Hydra vulgaris]|uniref:Uncharacterized protein LOC136087071 n=1 Tax=Hydra vulgaris TaxID=6087 RepID=A0ABM4CUQ5_HYDVU